MTGPESSTSANAKTITEHELEQCQRANQTGRQPVVFIHGLWLLPSSWDRWAKVFEDDGYVALTPGWPDDPETVEEAAAHPEVFAGKSIGQVADHFETIIRGLDQKPAIVGHSFGGLLTQILAGRGLAVASVAIDPAPFRGVLPLPISALKSGSPVLGNPANRNRAVPLTFEQFRYGFVNARQRGWRRPTICPRSLYRRPRPNAAELQSQPSVVAARSRVAATAGSPSTLWGTESGSRRLPSR